jgi:hypothetical protein
MNDRRTMNWDPQQDLRVLLDALTQELLGAFDHEVLALAGEASDAAEAVRRLLATAEAGCAAPPVPNLIGPGLRAHISRNQ